MKTWVTVSIIVAVMVLTGAAMVLGEVLKNKAKTADQKKIDSPNPSPGQAQPTSPGQEQPKGQAQPASPGQEQPKGQAQPASPGQEQPKGQAQPASPAQPEKAECQGFPCPIGKKRNKNIECGGQTCTADECCETIPTCDGFTKGCPNGKRKTSENTKTCTGQTCTADECCETIPRCDTSFQCPSDHKRKKFLHMDSQGRSNIYCAGQTCTVNDCCDTITCQPGFEPKNHKCEQCGFALPKTNSTIYKATWTKHCEFKCPEGYRKKEKECKAIPGWDSFGD